MPETGRKTKNNRSSNNIVSGLHWVSYSVDEIPGNLTLIYTSESMVKLVSLYLLSLKIIEPMTT